MGEGITFGVSADVSAGRLGGIGSGRAAGLFGSGVFRSLSLNTTALPIRRVLCYQMWSPPCLNVEPNVEPLRSRRSAVVAHRPPRPLVHLSRISGPVRSFFSCFRGLLGDLLRKPQVRVGLGILAHA